MLRNALAELCPAGYEIGTGFVLDPERTVHSKQLDIIVYDQSHSAPIFKNGELVIARPSSVISATEVKKTLTFRDIEQTIDGTFFANLGTRREWSGPTYTGIQKINIFGFASKRKILNLAAAVCDYLDRKIRYTYVRAGDKKRTGKVMVENICLPDIFLMNDRHYILSSLIPQDESTFKIGVTVYESHEVNGSVGAYMLNVLPRTPDNPVLKGSRHEDLSFIGSPINRIIEEISTKNVLDLTTWTSMDEIADHFAKDKAAIRAFNVNRKKPYAAHVPKGFDWRTLSSFREFVRRVSKWNFITGDERSLSD